MTLTQTERESLWKSFDAVTHRAGGVASRHVFDCVCDFAGAGDEEAQRTLLSIYRAVNRELRGRQRT